MRIQTLILTAALTTMVACGPAESPPAEEPTASLADVLPSIPLPPDGVPIATEGSGDAMQIIVSTPVATDAVVEFYRGVLSRAPYSLLNENAVGSSTSFFVEQDGPSLWVMVEGLPAGGTLVRIAGAASAKPPAAPAPSPDPATDSVG
jgi:hypothetical protein